jgi:hypothetical protein
MCRQGILLDQHAGLAQQGKLIGSHHSHGTASHDEEVVLVGNMWAREWGFRGQHFSADVEKRQAMDRE